MTIKLKQLQARLTEIGTQMTAILDGTRAPATENELGDLTAEVGRLNSEIETINTAITQLENLERTQPRAAAPAGAGAVAIASPWERPSDFLAAVRTAALGGTRDKRLVMAPTTAGREGVNEDGGYLVPVEQRTEILTQVFGVDSLASMCDELSIARNKVTLPVDTNAPWDNSSGIIASWTPEGGLKGQSSPKFGELEGRLRKITALVPMTDELLEDAPNIGAWIAGKVAEKFDYQLTEGIVRGDGVLEPLGFLNSSGRVIQTAESGQGASTVVAKNIVNMYSRMPSKSISRAVWLINPAVMPLLPFLVMPGGTQPVPLFLPPTGLAGAPLGTLMGRPVMVLDNMSALGSEGDIAFVDLKQYLLLKRAGNTAIKSDVSIHVFFDTDHTAFRYVLRVGGQPYFNAPVTPPNGGATRSGFVTLNATRT